ncbi:DUF2752 domain-containing protein [Flavobacterium silvaticum]|uniref:DUF2752 domain-containing protein n=1 Tax=Flavobacterium silvaticum TaxID=1852020 RepID=A0A972JGJ9_9FLAO|nr:DUF2752 domain-containing protein [Flavobacterium silvaticum]NMH28271.1 DUF2752 domain-containing protein [Flavobacterium silvaticum]
MTPGKLYSIVGLTCLAGYSWLAFAEFSPELSGFGICLFKHVVGIPCPSCGVTRAVQLLLQGNVRDSLLMNPLGILVALLALATPIWIVLDLLRRKQTFFRFYQKTESIIRRPTVATIFILLVLTNWFWGISKGL